MTQPDARSDMPLWPFLVIALMAVIVLALASTCNRPQPQPAPPIPAPVVTPISTIVGPTVGPIPTPPPPAPSATVAPRPPVAGNGGLLPTVSGWECGLPASPPCPPDMGASPMPWGYR